MYTQRVNAMKLAALACGMLLGGIAVAQPCPNQYDCNTLGPDGGWSLGRTGGTKRGFVPDRRPAYWFNIYGGDETRACAPVPNPKGQSPYWADAYWPELEERLNAIFDAGFRRIVIQRPGGSLPGETKVNQSQYHHLTDAQKSVIQNELKRWIACRRSGCDGRPAAPDLQMGVFIGSFQWEVCSPCMSPTGGMDDSGKIWWDCPPDAEMHFMDPNDPTSLQDTYKNIAPWAEAGFDSIWLDNASRRDPDLNQSPDALLALADKPAFESLVLGGEAVPWYKVDGKRYIDTYYTERAPWFAVYWWYRRTGWLGPKANNRHVVDPNTTELGVVFNGESHKGGKVQPEGAHIPFGIKEMAEARDAGYVVWASSEDMIPLVQRLYDGEDDELFASLVLEGNPVDFNGDGAVDCLDYMMFVEQWATSAGGWTADPSYWDGDVDNDDVVSLKDLGAFQTMFDWRSCR